MFSAAVKQNLIRTIFKGKGADCGSPMQVTENIWIGWCFKVFMPKRTRELLVDIVLWIRANCWSRFSQQQMVKTETAEGQAGVYDEGNEEKEQLCLFEKNISVSTYYASLD